MTVGTIFHRTHLPLQKWFLAIMLMLNARKGLSALQLSRDLDVNKNTAWRISMQIRKAMTQAEHRHMLTGIVEMDETYIGGKPRRGTKGTGKDGKHKPGRGTKKTPVIGAVERNGKVTAKAVQKDKMKGRHMRAIERDRVDVHRSIIFTDEYKGYLGMSKMLPHSVIKHADWYVDGAIHPRFKEHLAAVTALMRAAANWGIFQRSLKRALPCAERSIRDELGRRLR